MTDPITRDERALGVKIAQNQMALIDGEYLARTVLAYEAALTAAEAREAEKDARIRELEGALRQIAEAHHYMIEPDMRSIARAALSQGKLDTPGVTG